MSWIGFDLDKTLAKYSSGMAERFEIGEPIKRMVAKVKSYLRDGYEVRIFTARANKREGWDHERQIKAIEKWTKEQFGEKLKVTCEKDFEMICFYDDRAVRVEEDTGRLLSPDYPVHQGSR
jgi:FMN phosphatase YigB (HAD superfamily)